MLDYLKNKNFITYRDIVDKVTIHINGEIILSPDGINRVDEINRNTNYGRKAFVAMQYKGNYSLRKRIQEGIEKAGYEPIIMDEVEHNNLIVPEMLKQIRDSRFVVVELSDNNNGAYFEEGYAIGLGKPTIQLCQNEKKMHFDISQKNTLLWEKEEDIPEKLSKRIKATIE